MKAICSSEILTLPMLLTLSKVHMLIKRYVFTIVLQSQEIGAHSTAVKSNQSLNILFRRYLYSPFLSNIVLVSDLVIHWTEYLIVF